MTKIERSINQTSFRNHLEKKVAIRDGVSCTWCGCRLTMATFTIDHIFPLGRGGVSPTVPQCLMARLLLGEVTIYKTLRPTKGVQPIGVWDEFMTEERWILPGVRLQRYGKISRDVMCSITQDIANWHDTTKCSSNYRVRVATLWRACVALPEHTPKRLMRLADMWCETLDLDPLAIFDVALH